MRGTIRMLVLGVVLVVLVGGGIRYWRSQHGSHLTWRIAPIHRGDLTSVITATGTVEPEEVVDVGVQVSGQFMEFGKDKSGKPVDYGSIVESNMLLAKIDPTLFQASVDLDEAVVASDRAGEAQAAANVDQAKAKLEQAEADWNRAQKLGPSEALAPTTFDNYRATYEIAKASLQQSEAAVDSAKAATGQALATLKKDKQTLSYCTVYSPVNGVIIDRRVNLGETVAASLNTPSLFLIAKDLKRIQVWASVNEADIGNIHAGQDVTFTVDAFPNRVFHGKVNKVRLNATMNQNVVTYTVEVNTDNSDGRLLPYLTANVNFLAGSATNALLVANAALRWHPAPDLIAPEFRGAAAGATGHTGPPPGLDSTGAPIQTGVIYVKSGEFVKPLTVDLGITDGNMTEVRGDDLAEGMEVVTGASAADAAADLAPGANPFMPQFGQRRGPTNATPIPRGN